MRAEARLSLLLLKRDEWILRFDESISGKRKFQSETRFVNKTKGSKQGVAMLLCRSR